MFNNNHNTTKRRTGQGTGYAGEKRYTHVQTVPPALWPDFSQPFLPYSSWSSSLSPGTGRPGGPQMQRDRPRGAGVPPSRSLPRGPSLRRFPARTEARAPRRSPGSRRPSAERRRRASKLHPPLSARVPGGRPLAPSPVPKEKGRSWRKPP